MFKNSFLTKSTVLQDIQSAKCLFSLKTKPVDEIDIENVVENITSLLDNNRVNNQRSFLIFSLLCFSYSVVQSDQVKNWYSELIADASLVKHIFYLFLIMHRFRELDFSSERKRLLNTLNKQNNKNSDSLELFYFLDGLRIRRIPLKIDTQKSVLELFEQNDKDVIVNYSKSALFQATSAIM